MALASDSARPSDYSIDRLHRCIEAKPEDRSAIASLLREVLALAPRASFDEGVLADVEHAVTDGRVLTSDEFEILSDAAWEIVRMDQAGEMLHVFIIEEAGQPLAVVLEEHPLIAAETVAALRGTDLTGLEARRATPAEESRWTDWWKRAASRERRGPVRYSELG